MIRIKSLSNTHILIPTLRCLSFLSFSQVKKTQQKKEIQPLTFDLTAQRGSAAYFYRSSLKRLSESGKQFNLHHLLRITKLAQTYSDAILLFEAYYNYIGRNAVMTQTSVDQMIVKALKIINQKPIVQKSEKDQSPQNIEQIRKKVIDKSLQLFSRHDYLSYFPHYSVTKLLINATANNPQQYNKLLMIFFQKHLIKFDHECFMLMIQKLSHLEPQLASKSLKLVFQKILHMNFQTQVNPLGFQYFCKAIDQYCLNPGALPIIKGANYRKLINSYLTYINSENAKLSLNQLEIQNITGRLSIAYLIINQVTIALELLNKQTKFDQKTIGFWQFLLTKKNSGDSKLQSMEQIISGLNQLVKSKTISNQVSQIWIKISTQQ